MAVEAEVVWASVVVAGALVGSRGGIYGCCSMRGTQSRWTRNTRRCGCGRDGGSNSLSSAGKSVRTW